MSANGDHELLSPALPFRLLGSSPFTAPPNFGSPDIRLMPIEQKEPTRFSSLELLNALGDGFRNDEYYDTVNKRAQADLKAAWRNVDITDSTPLFTQEKFLIRRGVPDNLRLQVWKSLSGWSRENKERPTLYDDVLKRAFGNEKSPSIIRNYPQFGGLISPSDHYLIDECDEIVKRLLVVIGLEFPTLDYCPCIPDFVQILLTFMGEADAYGVLSCMLERSQDARKYILISKVEHLKFYAAFMKVLSKLIPRLHKHVVSLHVSERDTFNFMSNWFTRMFVSSFPYQAVLRIFDAFMNEGVKILYRFALAVLDGNKEALLKTTTSKEFGEVLHSYAANCDYDSLIKAGFAFQLSRSDMEMDYVPPSHVEDTDRVFYRPKISQPSAIIENDKFEILWAWIPHRYCIRDPCLVYSAENHGWSLSTIAYRCKNEAPLLLIVKSDSTAVFGAYLTHAPSPANLEFYGDRDCFLWTLHPATACYKWTMKNDLFIKSTTDYLLLGSGGKGHGLYIHKDMWGRTAACETFDNPPLEEANPDKFQILALEIYSFH